MATYKSIFLESKSLMPYGEHLFIGSNRKVFLCKKGMVGCRNKGMVQITVIGKTMRLKNVVPMALKAF